MLLDDGARVCLLFMERRRTSFGFEMTSLSMWRLYSRVYFHDGCSSLWMISSGYEWCTCLLVHGWSTCMMFLFYRGVCDLGFIPRVWFYSSMISTVITHLFYGVVELGFTPQDLICQFSSTTHLIHGIHELRFHPRASLL